MWMFLVLIYGVLKGVREIVKKKSLEKSSVMEVLFFYTLIGFLMVTPQYKQAMGVSSRQMVYIALKSFVIFLAWICSFKAIHRMPISLYGVLDLSRVLFATLLGTVVLHEVLSTTQIIGLIFVASGLLLLKYKPRFLARRQLRRVIAEGQEAVAGRASGVEANLKIQTGEGVEIIYIVFAFISCLLNAFSGLMDKLLMRELNSSQLQFWYMLFLALLYFAYLAFSRTRVDWKGAVKNYWIWILSLLFILADKALFLANGMAESRITVMTLIKQSGCVVTILAGKFIFREKNVGYKLFCACVIVIGIVVGVM
ncbi:MAG: EamA family transporter [Lachnospiraceae bacterium]|nr:EamA family transporter [Lachnospiraceae bacterium]